MKKFFVLGMSLLLAGCSLIPGGGGGNSGLGGGGTGGDGPFTGRLGAAAALGVPMKCSYTVDGVETEGWVKGQNFRGKMVQNDNVGNVIIKDACMWAWQDGQTQGVKTCFDEMNFWASEEDGAPAAPESAPNTNVEYRCMPGVFGDDKFIPPSSVKFMDFDNMMNGMPEDAQQMMEDMPAVDYE